MLAWGSKDTLFKSFSSGLATYWSRSRGEVWIKGKTSGNIQEIKSNQKLIDIYLGKS